MDDPYGTNIFEFDPHRDGPDAHRPRSREVHVEPGMVLEDVTTGFVGAVIRTEKSAGIYVIELEDRRGRRRSFPLGGGFWLDGRPIIALPPLPRAQATPQNAGSVSASGRAVTNSGSRRARPEESARTHPRVARQSRIWVEGRHDADLVQYVWGDDLADVGVV
ncbi:MAG: DUF3097 family protein, partial [Actinomyces sp.]|nr:DUF3097 family protein [Actinomyces sp.]